MCVHLCIIGTSFVYNGLQGGRSNFSCGCLWDFCLKQEEEQEATRPLTHKLLPFRGSLFSSQM